MNDFTFYNPTKIIFGKNKIDEIGKELAKDKVTKVLLLAGGGSIKKNGVYEQTVKSLSDNKVIVYEMWGVQANPILSKVNETIEFARKHEVQAIIAVGGGSVIDSAKAIATGYYLDDMWAFMQQKVKAEKALPIYTILTLSATGSEMNSGFVITNVETKQKWGGGSALTFPRVSIVDPSVQASLPWNQTVNGAFDALSHIMEFYFISQDNEATIALNESLMQTVIKSTDILQKNPKDYSARSALAWSATLALNGISGVGMSGGDWACHLIEHAISALYPQVAHGAGLGIVFPAWIEFMAIRHPEKFNRWSKVWGEDNFTSALIAMRNKIREWGNPVALRDLCIAKEDLGKIADKIMEFPSIGAMSKLSREDIEAILILAY